MPIINLPMSSGQLSGSFEILSECARFSITVTAPGRGSLQCCFGLIPFLIQTSLIRGINSAGGLDEG